MTVHEEIVLNDGLGEREQRTDMGHRMSVVGPGPGLAIL